MGTGIAERGDICSTPLQLTYRGHISRFFGDDSRGQGSQWITSTKYVQILTTLEWSPKSCVNSLSWRSLPSHSHHSMYSKLINYFTKNLPVFFQIMSNSNLSTSKIQGTAKRLGCEHEGLKRLLSSHLSFFDNVSSDSSPATNVASWREDFRETIVESGTNTVIRTSWFSHHIELIYLFFH